MADIDLSQAKQVKDCFPDIDFYLDVDSIANAISRRHQFNIIHPGSGLKVDVMIPARDSFNRSRFRRKKRLKISESAAAEFAAPEDVIIKKLQYYQKGGSDKHLRDVVSMLKISGSMIDDVYLSDWIDSLGLSDLWKSVARKL